MMRTLSGPAHKRTGKMFTSSDGEEMDRDGKLDEGTEHASCPAEVEAKKDAHKKLRKVLHWQSGLTLPATGLRL